MTTTRTASRKPLSFGTVIEFTNRWGQEGQRATVIQHTGDTVVIDYLGCQHEIVVSAINRVI